MLGISCSLSEAIFVYLCICIRAFQYVTLRNIISGVFGPSVCLKYI